MKRTDINTLIEAMRILSEGIQSEDGVANAAIAEAGQRLQEQNDYIKRLENEGDYWMMGDCLSRIGMQEAQKAWNKLRESKP